MKALSTKKQMLRDSSGVAAIEFAFIAPVLIILSLGVIELSDAIQCHGKVGSMAAIAADLVAQGTALSDGDEQNIFAAASSVMYPFSPSKARIVISSIASNGVGLTPGSLAAVPPGLLLPGGSVILAQVTYDYTSPVSADLIGTVKMSTQSYSVPRLSAQVSRTR
jgi:Flp pilus assembly protein TadG